MHLRINNLPDCGPGDILGAIRGETELNPGVVGEIQIHGRRAELDVDEETASRLAEQLDNIAGAPVEAHAVEEHDYYERMRRLVQMEREAEMQRHEQSIRKLTGQEREDEGKAFLHMQGRDAGEGIEGFKVKFTRGEQLPDHQFTVGDLAMISKDDPLQDDNPTGTVIQVTNYSVTVAFDHPPPEWLYDDARVDLYVNDITYQRMLEAIDALQTGRCSERVKQTILREERPVTEKTAVELNNDSLNTSQRTAVRRSLGSDWHCIHGPPGTGKTTTLIEITLELVKEGKDVLVTAASNTAVDNLLEFLLDRDVDTVRVGHPARVTPALHDATLDSIVQDYDLYEEAMRCRERAFSLKDEQDELTYPSGRYRRGMSNAKIKELARKGRGARGVSPEIIEEMAEWIELDEEIDQLFTEAESLRDEAVDQVLDEHDVVCSTNSTAGSDILSDRLFDSVVIDEATQATEPSCLIPLVHGDQVVMAGDHKQLSPTVLAAEELEETLFERTLSEETKTTLSVQYRMHADIMGFSNEEFYDGVLTADDTVRAHTLSDHNVHVFDHPLVFIDTNGDLPERQRHGSTSRENPGERDIVEGLVDEFCQEGLEDIGVITPYDDQKELIEAECEVDTVDGFQGREKECIIVSFVRSNPAGDLGFLTDYRRLNVALTRARRQLVLVGDATTLTTDDTYKKLLEYVQSHGCVISHQDL